MAIASMTGFGRSAGRVGLWTWVWEIRSVNAKGLDMRLRMPSGFDAIDSSVRAALSAAFVRGACHANLTAVRDRSSADIAINRPLLDSLIDQLAKVPHADHIQPASLDGLLSLRGVIDERESEEDEESRAILHRALLEGLATAISSVSAMRLTEGASIGAILHERISRIAALVKQADETPGRSVEAIKAKIAHQIEAFANIAAMDPGRLHQEAVLLASRADIREELDRLATHAAAVQELLNHGGAIGRKLDFLSQELGRESNTLCAKSNDRLLTAIGLDLKIEIEQFREQIQNIE